MQAVNLIFSAFLFVTSAISSGAQSLDLFPDYLPAPEGNYRECAAILFDGEMLVDKYTPEGKCILNAGNQGKLSVSTVNLSDGKAAPKKAIGFRIAIKNDRTNTLWMYSKETLYEVNVHEVLKKCEEGDRLFIMTVDQKYSLTHHEIEISWGC